ncbi:MAG: hypothetical protein IIC69_03355 [Nanoarchaeota archaeon]|nr:hypothetical protein [Nanoarchaeota archaeon]
MSAKMLKSELEKEVKSLRESLRSKKAEAMVLEKEKKDLTEELVRLQVIRRDNADALKQSTLYIKMILRNQYT